MYQVLWGEACVIVVVSEIAITSVIQWINP